MILPFELRKSAFIQAGKELEKVLDGPVENLSTAGLAMHTAITSCRQNNYWFSPENVKLALSGIRKMLQPDVLDQWLSEYSVPDLPPSGQKTIAVIMAGNIPFVGFHDMMCVLLSGHRFLGKLSSQDKELPVKFADLLIEAQPGMKDLVSFSEGTIHDFEAVIATGSNNSARYFEYYFGKYPHIIRKNRNSIAVLSGNETKDELTILSDDIFQYYGMGCRNVSKVLLPKDYDVTILLDSFQKWEFLKDHHKYFNNYEYQKAILLVNGIPHFDTGFSILKKDEQLASALAVLHYQEYTDLNEAENYIKQNLENIQCIVASDGLGMDKYNAVKPGDAQSPGPGDYADGVDTLAFLLNL